LNAATGVILYIGHSDVPHLVCPIWIVHTSPMLHMDFLAYIVCIGVKSSMPPAQPICLVLGKLVFFQDCPVGIVTSDFIKTVFTFLTGATQLNDIFKVKSFFTVYFSVLIIA
jgi:hypothetical protein